MCHFKDQEEFLEKARNHLILVLRILKKNLPRTLVNVVVPPNVARLSSFEHRPDECKSMNYMQCPCILSISHLEQQKAYNETILRWKVKSFDVVRFKNNFCFNQMATWCWKCREHAGISRSKCNFESSFCVSFWFSFIRRTLKWLFTHSWKKSQSRMTIRASSISNICRLTAFILVSWDRRRWPMLTGTRCWHRQVNDWRHGNSKNPRMFVVQQRRIRSCSRRKMVENILW